MKTKKPLKDYAKDEDIRLEAAKKGLDKNLLAYQKQKTDKQAFDAEMRERNRNDR